MEPPSKNEKIPEIEELPTVLTKQEFQNAWNEISKGGA